MRATGARPAGKLRERGKLVASSSHVATAQVLLVLVWLACGAMWRSGSSTSPRGPGVWWCMPGMAPGGDGGGSLASVMMTGLPGWLLMVVGMTLPGVLPAAEHVAINTFRRRRSATVGMFFAVYLLVWLAVGAPVLALAALGGVRAGGALFAVSLALAGGYELSLVKRRALNRCHRTVPLPPSGTRGLLAVSRFGWVNTSGCIGACWVSMLTMLTVAAGKPLVMLALTATATYGRLARRPDRARRQIAAVYTAGAALVLACTM